MNQECWNWRAPLIWILDFTRPDGEGEDEGTQVICAPSNSSDSSWKQMVHPIVNLEDGERERPDERRKKSLRDHDLSSVHVTARGNQDWTQGMVKEGLLQGKKFKWIDSGLGTVQTECRHTSGGEEEEARKTLFSLVSVFSNSIELHSRLRFSSFLSFLLSRPFGSWSSSMTIIQPSWMKRWAMQVREC